MNIFILNLKKSIITILCLGFIFSLLFFSTSNIESAKAGLLLWANSVVPSLFPFFIATELLYCTNLIVFFEKYCNKFMKKIFNLSGEAIFPIIMGTISGYPTGAKIVNELRCDRKISKTEGEHLLAFTNNSGPLFIIGTVGTSIFCSKKIGFILLIAHILGAFSVGFLFRFWKPNRKNLFIKNPSTQDINKSFITTLINSISKSIITILNIGGFIVLFSVIISIFENSGFYDIIANISNQFGFSKSTTIGFISGILELTNGIKKLSIIGTKNLNTIILLSSFLLGFGGLSVAMQVYSCIQKSDLSIKPYLIGKLFHGLFSVFYTLFFLILFN